MSPSAGFTTIPDLSGLGSSLSSRSILRTSPIGAVLVWLFVLKLLDEPGEKLGGETCGRDGVSGIDDEDTGDGTGDASPTMYSPPSASTVDVLPNGLSRISSRSEFCNKDFKPTVGNFVVSTAVTLANEASLVDIVFFIIIIILIYFSYDFGGSTAKEFRRLVANNPTTKRTKSEIYSAQSEFKKI